MPGITFYPTDDLTVTLLHPSDPKLNVTIRVDKDDWLLLDRGDTHICENFAASKTIDQFCVGGYIYLTHSLCGRGSSRDEQNADRLYVCHCGVEFSRKCHHVCRDVSERERLKKRLLRQLEREKKAEENLRASQEDLRASEQKLASLREAAARHTHSGEGWGWGGLRRGGGWGLPAAP
jgi:hypothetical protein